MKLKVLFVLLTGLVFTNIFAQNLIPNGNFESGNGIGFQSDYNYTNPGSGQLNSIPRQYAIVSNSQLLNTTNFISSTDFSGTGLMLVADGASGQSENFWKTNGDIQLIGGATYIFNYFVRSVNNTNPQAQIGFRLMNAAATDFSSSYTVLGTASGWQQVSVNFAVTGSGNQFRRLELYNINQSAVGNDFAIDNISLVRLLPLNATYSSTNLSCTGANDGSIQVYANNGISPYTYTLTGATTPPSNNTGFFANLPAGTYNVTITDSSLPVETVSLNGIVISNPTNPLTVGSNAALCIGSNYSLSVNGGNTYTWTASPPDASLVNPNYTNPTVTPLVTTTYTVSSTVSSMVDLINNGGFESGNQNFTSDYQYLTTSTVAGVQGAYGIVTNPSAWFTPFSTCPDHTSGTGNMMVVDGSILNSGNDKVWCQTVTVIPGENYNFSYFIQNLSAGNLANIEVEINGVSIGSDLSPVFNAATCSWTQRNYTWNSGASTTAQICIYDRNVLVSGNDFALDDISFTYTNTCTFTKNVTLTVNPRPNIVLSGGVLCATNTTTTIPVTATITGVSGPLTYQWTVPPGFTGPIPTGNTFNTNVAGTYSLVVTHVATGCQSFPVSTTITTNLPSASCSNAEQGCPGGGYTYCNTTGVPSTGSVGCLGTNPNPAWFYFQIGSNGNIDIFIQQYANGSTTPNLDVDFICYGPFTSAPQCSGLGASNTVDCSYSTAATETCNIPNAIAGQFYMIMITNYSNNSGTISFSQSNINNPGAGSVSCDSFCNLTIIGDHEICSGTSTTLSSSLTGNSYSWTSTAPGFVNPGSVQYINVSQPGTYSLNVVRPGCIITPANFNLSFYPSINANQPIDLSICSGNVFDLSLNTSVILGTLSPSDYEVTYFTSNSNAINYINSISNENNYIGNCGDEIFVRVEDNNSSCFDIFSFHLLCNGNLSPVISCGAFSSTSAEFTWSSLTGATDYEISYQVNTGPIVTVGPIGNVNSYTVTGLNSGDNVTITVLPIGGASTCFVSASNTCNTSVCGTITNPQGDQTLCLNSDPTVISVDTSETTTDAISFVYFTTQQTGNAMYSGGTPLSLSTADASGVASYDMPVLGSLGSLPNATGTYYIYGIFNPTPTDPLCRPFQEIIIVINPLPTATISGGTTVCKNATAPVITFTGANGTAPYTFDYTINGTAYSIVTTTGNSVTVTAPTNNDGTFNYVITNVADANCSQTQSATTTVVVNPLPTATISGGTTVCKNATAPVITFTGANGTAPYTFDYTINGTAYSIVTTTGNSVTVTAPTNNAGTFNYVITNVADANCSQTQNVSTTVVVNPLPTATISGGTTVCKNSTAPTITFTGANGTAPYTFDYTINGTAYSIVTTTGNSVTVTAPTNNAGTFNYVVTNVADANCNQTQSATTTVIVNPLPTATISGGTTVCKNATAPVITFTGANGTAPYTFDYTINGTAYSIATTTGNSVTVTAPTNNAGTFNYVITNVADANCNQTQSATTTVVVNPLPTATISGGTTVCKNSTAPTITFTGANGTAPYTFNYTINGTAYSIATTTGNSVTVTAPTNNAGTFNYVVTNVADANCSQTQSATTTVIVNPLPTATISGGTTVCLNDAQPTITFTGANGTAPYTFSYTINTVLQPTITTISGNSITITAPTINDGTFNYVITNVADAYCNQTQSATTTVIVNPLPVVNAPLPLTQCSVGATPNQSVFDLTLNNDFITGGLLYDVTYYTTQAAADAGVAGTEVNDTNYIGTNGETVYIRVENPATGCYSTTSILLNVTSGPIANNPGPLAVCDPNNEGIGVDFDLDSLTAAIIAGNTSPVTVTYHETETDAQLGLLQLTSPYQNIDYFNQTIYANVSFVGTTSCPNIIPIQLVVNKTPIFPVDGIPDFELCDYVTTNDAQEPFYLHDHDAVIVNGQPNTAVEYYASQPDAINQTPALPVPFISGSQTIWVNIYDTLTGCNRVSSMNLVVNPVPVPPATIDPYTICDDDSRDGYEVFDLQSQENTLLNGQLGMSVTWYESYQDAVDDVTANIITTTSAYTNTVSPVQTVGIRITNETTGCYVVLTMDLRVESKPTPIAPIVPYSVCDDDQNGIGEFNLTTLTSGLTLGSNYNVTYHLTEIDAENGFNAIPDEATFNNVVPFIDFVYASVVDPLYGCRTVIPIELNVNPGPNTPLPATLDDLVVCDDYDANNQDGEVVLNLTQVENQVVSIQPLPASSYTVTYYTTEADANAMPNGTNQIISTTNYNTLNGKNIWIRIENNATGCYNLVSFTIVVNTPLLLNVPAPILRVCDTDATPNDGFTTFDLTQANAGLLATPTTAPYAVNYYTSYTSGMVSGTLIANPTAFINQTIGTQTLGVEVIDENGCKSYTSLTIRALPLPTPNTNPQMLAPQCENAVGSGQQTFDITVNASYILNNTSPTPDVTLHYYHTLADAEAGTNEINVSVNPNVLIGDAALATQVPRPVNLVQYVYIASQYNQNLAGTNVGFNGQTCKVIVAQPYIINPLPTVNTGQSFQICEEDSNGNDGFEVFNLTDYELNDLGILADGLIDNTANYTNPISNYVVTYYTDAAHTMLISNPTAYTNQVVNQQTIYFTVSATHTFTYTQPGTTNSVTYSTSCESSGMFDIIVNPKPAIAPPLTTVLNTCDDVSENDGYMYFDLTSMNTEILAGQDPTLFSVTYYESEYNPDANTPLLPTPIIDTQHYLAYTHTIWAVVSNIVTGCFKSETIDLVVEQLPEPVISNDPALNTICVDFNTKEVVRTLTLEVINNTNYLTSADNPLVNPDPNQDLNQDFEYHWFENGAEIAVTTTPFYEITEPLINPSLPSQFSVQMINLTTLGCTQTSADYEVIQSGQATIQAGTEGYTVTNAFTDNQIITVTIDGYGEYQYSLDDGPRQDSPIFEHVSLGEHTIYVWDTKGGLGNSCDVFAIHHVQTIDYPLYFTPNGDGYHDTWNIEGLQGQPTAKIYIFDRFGKLIKQISSTGNGWDGTYNGQLLPSTDYWFTVDYIEQNKTKQFKAHFSLKR